jgi:hypothetical protein
MSRKERRIISKAFLPESMRSQVSWGIALIVLGAVIAAIGFPYLLLWGIPIVLIGIGLVLYRNREETIEQVHE